MVAARTTQRVLALAVLLGLWGACGRVTLPDPASGGDGGRAGDGDGGGGGEPSLLTDDPCEDVEPFNDCCSHQCAPTVLPNGDYLCVAPERHCYFEDGPWEAPCDPGYECLHNPGTNLQDPCEFTGEFESKTHGYCFPIQ